MKNINRKRDLYKLYKMDIIDLLEKNNYVIHQEGEVFSTKSKHFLTKKRKGNFYTVRVQVEIDGVKTYKEYRLNVLVALKFLPNPNSYKYVHYSDGNRCNDQLYNLRWESTEQKVFVESRIVEIAKPDVIVEEVPEYEPKDITNYDDAFTDIKLLEDNQYSIRDDGTIWSDKSKKFLGQASYNGYLCINLKIETERKCLAVHRLVALKFISNPEKKPYVNHKDSNKTNNHVSNLEWCTQKENCAAHNKDISHPRAVLKLDKDGNVIGRFNSILEAGESVGLSRAAVSKVVNGINKTAGGFGWKYEKEDGYTTKVDISKGKKITGYKSYYVFSDGTIYNSTLKQVLKPVLNDNGYVYVTLSKTAKIKQNTYVHRIVAEHYLINDDPENKNQVNHKKKNEKTNNNVTNLEWVTPSENMIHALSF